MTPSTRYVTVSGTTAAVGPRQYALVEYPYECSCGEEYRKVAYAVSCRKCRVYSMGGRCLYVHDVRTGELVYGRLPTADEEAEYMVEMEREAEETRDFIAMCEKEGQRYERIMADRAAEAAATAADLDMDQMHDLQDQLMGY